MTVARSLPLPLRCSQAPDRRLLLWVRMTGRGRLEWLTLTALVVFVVVVAVLLTWDVT